MTSTPGWRQRASRLLADLASQCAAARDAATSAEERDFHAGRFEAIQCGRSVVRIDGTPLRTLTSASVDAAYDVEHFREDFDGRVLGATREYLDGRLSGYVAVHEIADRFAPTATMPAAA